MTKRSFIFLVCALLGIGFSIQFAKNSTFPVKFEVDDGLYHSDYKFGSKEIKVTSSIATRFVTDTVTNTENCALAAAKPFITPTVTVTDANSGAKTVYKVVSPFGSKAAIGSVQQDHDYLMMRVNYYKTACFSDGYTGNIKINLTEELRPVKYPLDVSIQEVNLRNTSTGEILPIDVLPLKAHIVYSDFNADTINDQFIYYKREDGKYSVFMFDEENEVFSPWFNGGKVLVLDEDVEQATREYQSTHDFIRRFAAKPYRENL